MRTVFACLPVVLVAAPLLAQTTANLQSRPLFRSFVQSFDELERAVAARKQAAATDADYGTVRLQLRGVIAKMETLDALMTELLQKTYQRRPSELKENDWTVRELESLARNLQAERGRAYRNQAMCYPAGSVDRTNALGLALETLRDVSEQPVGDRSVWHARVELVTCLRMLDKHDEATKLTAGWQQDNPPAAVAVQLAETAWLIELRASESQRPPPAESDDPQVLSEAAAKLYAAKKLRAAVTAYDRLAKLHAKGTEKTHAFDARKTAAAIVRELKLPAEALVRFRQLAMDFPRHDDAAGAHFVAVGLAAEQLRDVAPARQAAALRLYREMLEEHLEKWPDAPSAKTVRQWQRRLRVPALERTHAASLAAAGKRDDALAMFRRLVKDAPDDGELRESFAALLATGSDEAELREALAQWQRIEQRSKPGGPRWTRGRRARLKLLHKLGEGDRAERLRQLTELLYE